MKKQDPKGGLSHAGQDAAVPASLPRRFLFRRHRALCLSLIHICKLFDDHHAERVLPGFAPDSKIRMLTQLSDQAEVVIAINAADIEKNKVRGDLGITYDADVLRLIDAFRGMGLYVGSVVITRFAGQTAAEAFQRRLEELGVRVYRHYPIQGYPHIN